MKRHLLLVSVIALLGWGLLSILAATPAAEAQEDDEDGGLFGIDIGEINLDDENLDEIHTYEGTASQASPNYKPGTTVTITHTKGTITVRCTDTDGLTARLQYTLEGDNKDKLKAYGDALGISTWASNYSASVKTRVPGLYSGVDSAKLALTIMLPTRASLVINGSNDWIQVTDCTGTIKASTRQNGIYARGNFSSFNLSASTGNVELSLAPESEITSSSRATASAGDITIYLPLTQSANLSASGSEVSIAHLVSGTNTPSKVTGTINDGGPSITLSAKGRIDIKPPE